MPNFQLIEVILYVKDMAQQVLFYRDVLGLPVTEPRGVTDFSGEFWVVLDAGGFRLVLHGGGQDRLGPDTPNLGFRVADIHAARAHLLRTVFLWGKSANPCPLLG